MREFATALGCSHSAVSNWAAGKAEPETEFLMHCSSTFSDWRHEFAQRILFLRFPNTSIIPTNAQPLDHCEVCGALRVAGHSHG